MARKIRRIAEIKALRADLVERLNRLDFRFESLGPAFAKMTQDVERTLRRLEEDSGA